MKYQNIQHIFFTHLHEDHYLDLLPFLNTLSIQVLQWGVRPRTIKIYGPKGTRKKLTRVLVATGILPSPGITVQFRELGKSTVTLDGLLIRSQLVHHMKGINALVFRIEKDKKVLAYTGDLDYDESIIPFLKGAHTLVIECGFPNHMKKAGHLTPREAGIIAKRAGVKRVVLTHRYAPCDRVDVMWQCRKEFGGRILLARDLLALMV